MKRSSRLRSAGRKHPADASKAAEALGRPRATGLHPALDFGPYRAPLHDFSLDMMRFPLEDEDLLSQFAALFPKNEPPAMISTLPHLP